jgi:hypothetical protein
LYILLKIDIYLYRMILIIDLDFLNILTL